MKKNLLLELGTEEIPARFISSIKRGMKDFLEKELKELRIDFGQIQIKSTPRRFAILIKDLEDMQKSDTQVIKGPAKKIAYDSEGNPSKALQGFLNSKNVKAEDIFIQEDKGQEYIYVNKTLEAKKTETYFESLFEDMVGSLVFDKPMKWGQSKVKFIRPIRWILLIYGDEVLNKRLFGLKTSNITKGHRFLGSQNIVVDKIENYEKLLEENYCILDDNKRKNLIRKQVDDLATKLNGHIVEDEGLLDEINYIVEYPTALYGDFDKEFLKLPKEAVITPMKEHQRYFPVLDEEERLMPHFITVRNGDDLGIENVKIGNEKVLEARLQDANFFYDQDTSKRIEEFLPNLEKIVYHEKLGSMADKTNRIIKISEKIASLMDVDEENIKRAAKLSKADLTTSFVNEFTELQGIMGYYYSLVSGEDEKVAMAIKEHYLPRFAGDILPKTDEGVILSIADKLDSLCGFFAVDIKPTGSQDPYALRRQAIGLVNILEDRKIRINTKVLLEIALAVYKEKMDFDYDKTLKDLMEFIRQRTKNILLDKGIDYDIVEAVQNDDDSSIYSLEEKAKQISSWRRQKDRADVVNAFTRVINISKDSNFITIDESLFQNQEERALYEVFENIRKDLDEEISNMDYQKALNTFSQIVPEIDRYFEKVMINVDDQKIKVNRLSQISLIRDYILRIGNFSEFVL